MNNEFLHGPIEFLAAAIETRMDCRAALETVKRMLEEIPVQAAYCPVCSDQYDVRSGEVPPPTVVRKRACGHWCCDRCAKMCADLGCSSDGCADCMPMCEGCAEPHCHEHQIQKCYCEDCAPGNVLQMERRPAYCFEGER